MKITDALLGEHAVLYALFDHVEELAESTDEVAELRAAIATVGAALISHARLEDEVLFPPLGDIGPVAVMRAEHEEVDRRFLRLSSTTDIDDAREQLAAVLELVRAHFMKEEQVLFPMVDSQIDESANHQLGEQWARLRNV